MTVAPSVRGDRFDGFWSALAEVPVAADAEALYVPATTAGALRRANLARYLLLAAEQGSRTLLVAEAPGWRGMTNTGLPFMSVRELTTRPGPITGAPDGDGFVIPPEPSAVWEASSRVVHAVLAEWPAPRPVAWPVFPHHPFVADHPLTNRTPRASEVLDGGPVVLALAEALGIERFVAVGRKAQHSLAVAGVDAIAVRHPAQGGAKQFAAAMAALAP